VILLPSSCLLMGNLAIGFGLGFLRTWERKFCNVSSDIFFNIFNKMNSYMAYFDVSHNIEIIHLNDSNEFKNEINKQLERKLNLLNWLLKLLIWAMTRIHA